MSFFLLLECSTAISAAEIGFVCLFSRGVTVRVVHVNKRALSAWCGPRRQCVWVLNLCCLL